MPGELLLDTGALVSILDRRQTRHRQFSEFFEAWTGVIVSTEAVPTEATHLLGRIQEGRQACLNFFIQGGATLVPSSASSLRRCQELIAKYADLPMDYADATLVALAEELETGQVLTTDSDFAIYRLRNGQALQALPQ